MKTLFIVKLVE